jgi:hypothetical protein
MTFLCLRFYSASCRETELSTTSSNLALRKNWGDIDAFLQQPSAFQLVSRSQAVLRAYGNALVCERQRCVTVVETENWTLSQGSRFVRLFLHRTFHRLAKHA